MTNAFPNLLPIEMKRKEDNRFLWKFASLGSQILIGIGLCLYIGSRTDQWLHIATPMCVWIFPLLFILAVIVKTIKETNIKK